MGLSTSMMQRHSLLYSSTTGIIVSLRPSSVRSTTNSSSRRDPCVRPPSCRTRYRWCLPGDAVFAALRHLQPLPLPQPMHPLLVHSPAFPPQKRLHPTVAVARVLPQVPDHSLNQPPIPILLPALVALARPGLADRPARPTLGEDPELPSNELDGRLPPGLSSEVSPTHSFRMPMFTA
jgi:hypothetical protein